MEEVFSEFFKDYLQIAEEIQDKLNDHEIKLFKFMLLRAKSQNVSSKKIHQIIKNILYDSSLSIPLYLNSQFPPDNFIASEESIENIYYKDLGKEITQTILFLMTNNGYSTEELMDFSLRICIQIILENLEQHEFYYANSKEHPVFYRIYLRKNSIFLEVLGRGDVDFPKGVDLGEKFTATHWPWPRTSINEAPKYVWSKVSGSKRQGVTHILKYFSEMDSYYWKSQLTTEKQISFTWTNYHNSNPEIIPGKIEGKKLHLIRLEIPLKKLSTLTLRAA